MQVLIDRSTGRITSGQRVSLSSVEDSAAEQRDGVTYYVYEHVSQVGAGGWVLAGGCWRVGAGGWALVLHKGVTCCVY